MTRMQKVLMDQPNIVPELLVVFHCPAEFGLLDGWPPDVCIRGEQGLCRCRECWLREIPEGKEGTA